MKNIKLTIEYDGSNYFGWQKQNNKETVQETIERAILAVTGEKINLTGSSRTDTGVHAKGMVANFKTNTSIPPNKIKFALNNKLPDDIVIINSEEVSEDFHSRYNSKGKTYCYTIINRKDRLALGRNYAYQFKWDLDIERMKSACKYFLGEHDFCAFMSSGSSVKTTVRTINELYIENNKDEIKIFISANGFLYNMVRIIVGTLIMVGIGKISDKDITDIIESKDRTKAGACVPANGLTLEKVYY